jgi:hypothetical protein
MYEGITGLVTDPIKGAKKEGAAGFIKGVGRGIAGVPLRVMGGVFAVPGYTMKGLYQESMKNKGANVQNYIIAARISQGYDEAQYATPEEREDIVATWKCIKLNVKKKKNIGEDQIEALHVLMKERRDKRQQKWAKINSHFKRPEARPSFSASIDHSSYEDLPDPARTYSVTTGTRSPSSIAGLSLQQTNSYPRPPTAHSTNSQLSLTPLQQRRAQEDAEEAERQELEAAIRASVAETSRGNPDEDDMIERAIRASMTELANAPEHEDEEVALQRAMTASVEEAGKHGATEEEQKLLEETLKKSLLDKSARKHGSDSEWNSSDTEDDEEYQRIIAESKELAHLHATDPTEYTGHTASGSQESGVLPSNPGNGPNEEEELLKKALAESEEAEKARMSALEKQKTEEEIVMEYVKKQSLAEEEHRRRLAEGRDVGGESSSAAGN